VVKVALAILIAGGIGFAAHHIFGLVW